MRKICIYTSGRMDYGLLRGVIKEIQASEDLELQILASGMHLSPEFGNTIDEMVQDGSKPDETVEILLSSDSPVGICKSMGLAMIGYGEALQRMKPDILVLLGDRFETFCMAAAAQVCRVPVAHIHGGETTEGAIDDAFRHAITKMSHLHFTSTEEYRWRVIQLGEHPDRVFNVGALGVENIRKTALMTRTELSQSIGFNLDAPYFVVTFHPVTLEKDSAGGQFKALLDALEQFPEYKVIFTKTNADTDGRVINRMIDRFVEKHPERCMAAVSLGMVRYLSAVKYSKAVIGNSSSGIVEVPSFKVPTINIGDRQKGRVRPLSVIDCESDQTAIVSAIKRAMDPEFSHSLESMTSSYEKDNTARSIVDTIGKISLGGGVLKKRFHDLDFSHFSEHNPAHE
jgi:GDP/UDP-N,N'-diacetylbacillosamine 2-epimerase (hydrolysing)